MKYSSNLIAAISLLFISLIASSFLDKQSNIDSKPAEIVSKNDATSIAALPKEPKTILEIADSICQEAHFPYELIYEIGKNESNWTYIKNTNGGSDFGDLQVIDQTYWYWYKRLNLKGGKTRKNYLKVGIYYLKYLHNKYGTWEKARFAYGRGHWREPYTWTHLEKKFMRKIDFSKYDSLQIPIYASKNIEFKK